MYRDTIKVLTGAVEQHKTFFAPRLPHMHEQLVLLIHRCRQLLRLRKRAQARELLTAELFRLYGVAPAISDDRPLSLLAGLMRHVLISSVRMQQELPIRNEVNLLVEELGAQLDVTSATGGAALLALDAGLELMVRRFPEEVSLLEMRYFAQLGLRDMARELQILPRMIRYDLNFAQAALPACRVMSD